MTRADIWSSDVTAYEMAWLDSGSVGVTGVNMVVWYKGDNTYGGGVSM